MEIPEESLLRSILTGDRSLDALTRPAIQRENPSAQGFGRDTVQLTDRGCEYRDAVQRAHMLPDVRLDRVNQVKQRLAAGTYQVEGDKIAANLMDETLENNIVLKHIQHKG